MSEAIIIAKTESLSVLVAFKSLDANLVEYDRKSLEEAKELIQKDNVNEVSLVGYIANKKKVTDSYKWYPEKDRDDAGEWKLLGRKV
ncbi:MAG: hypothetical protein OEV44_11900 [Spirochaetota bacterium]|nr:hypothetical protein [Spirochaetota bacterium]